MNLLFYGDDPQGATGYARQAKNILSYLSKFYNIAAIGINRLDESPYDPFSIKPRLPYKIYRANKDGKDAEGKEMLIYTFNCLQPDILFIMGDLWFFRDWFPDFLETMQFRKKFVTIGYFSTEFPIEDSDKRTLNLVDFPISHSKWGLGFENNAGFDVISRAIPKLIYIPDSVDSSVFYPLEAEQRKADRQSMNIGSEKFILITVNRNSNRKDIACIIKAYKRIKKEIPDSHLYLHTSPIDSWMPGEETKNLHALCRSLSLSFGESTNYDVSFPVNFLPRYGYPDDILNRIYNSADLFISTSVSEGFGVTPIEALFTDLPILIPGHTGFSNICETAGIEPVRSYPVTIENIASCPVYRTDEDDLVNRIMNEYESRGKVKAKLKITDQAKLARNAYSLNNVQDKYWARIVDSVSKKMGQGKKKAVLFVQHSSAGDIFLSTSVLSGLKARHKDYPIYYLTQSKYHDIVKNNPNIEGVLDYCPSIIHDFEFVYKPHEEKILRGNWGAGETQLGYLYAQLLNLTYSKPYIDLQKPELTLPARYIAVHTTSHPYRTYRNFHLALDGSLIPVVQIGGRGDYIIGNGNFEFIDSRGLTYRESAYIISNATYFLGIDSFPAHVAGLFDIPSVVIFGSGNPRITYPVTSGKLLRIEPDYVKSCPIIGPCFGNFACNNPCGPRHSPNIIKQAMRKIMPDVFYDARAKLEELLCQ